MKGHITLTLKVSLYQTIVIAGSVFAARSPLSVLFVCFLGGFFVFGPTLGKQQLATAPSRVG